MKNMFEGKAFSPIAFLAQNIGAGDTVIPVTDISAFPPAPNYATIGTDDEAETVQYNALTETELSGCIRGVEGTAKAWGKETVIARNFTNADYEKVIENIEELDEELGNKANAANPTLTGTVTIAGSGALRIGTSSSHRGYINFGDGDYVKVGEYETDDKLSVKASTYQFYSGSTSIGTASASGFALLGAPTAPTAATGTNTTQIATTGFVQKEVDDLTTRQPNFSEANETSATLSENIAITNPILGAGWSLSSGSGATGTYTHTAGNTANLSFPVTIVKDKFYEIKHTETSTGTTNYFDLYFCTSETDTSGQPVRSGLYGSYDFVIQASSNYSHFNVIPKTGWSGNFKLTSIKELIGFNSESLSVKDLSLIVKNNGMLFGSGGKYITTGIENTSMGRNALLSNVTGNKNTAMGENALLSNTKGSENTAIGHDALKTNITGSGNVSVGLQTLRLNTTGADNIAIGRAALASNTTGSTNIANGYSALISNTTGGGNVANGYMALRANTTGDRSVAYGYMAGGYLSNGSTSQTIANRSIFIGAESRGSATDGQENQIVIGCQAIGQGSNTAHIGNSSVTTISYGSGTGTAFTNRSDPRIKEDIQEANLEMCYNDIKSLPLHRFKYKDFVGNTGDKHLTGFLSNEFAKLLPKAVHKSTASFDEVDAGGNVVQETLYYDELIEKTIDGEDVYVIVPVEQVVNKQIVIEDCESIDTSQIVPTLMGAVQMLMQKIEELEAKIS